MGSHKTDKKSKKDKKSSKEKSSRKYHKHKRHKKRKKHDSSCSSSSSDSDSGYEGAGSALSQLERERAAVQAVRYLLSSQPAIRKSFRELLWELDNGRSVGLSGVPDELLRSQLQYTLELLGLKCTKGQYWLPSGTPTALSVIGFVFDEPTKASTVPPPGMPLPARQEERQGQQQQQQQSSEPEQMQDAAAAAAAAEEEVTAGVVVGPAGPPGHPADELDAPPDRADAAEVEAVDDHIEDEAPAESAPKRRRVGPAAPPPEVLAAAAAYHAELEAAGAYTDAEAAEGPGPGPQQDILIGPPPPEFVDEADAAPADAREAAVVRVMRALREAAADAPPAAAGPQAPPAAAPVPDPYTVLGVDADADTASVRKAYWRLSLLVHPDKCSHPSAHEAFQAVSKAAKLLQDAEARKAHDAAAEDAALRKAAMAAAAAAERQAAWAAARGEALPPEVAAQLAAARAAAAGPAVRETWMTDLPPEKRGVEQALANLSQVSQTSFNRFGTRSRGDTSGWTDTPQQAAMRAAGLLTDGSGSARLAIAGPGAAGEGAAPVSAVLKAAMEQYGQGRQKSLLELHAERKAGGSKGPSSSKSEKQRGDKEKEKKSKSDEKERKGKSEEKDRDKKRDKDKKPAGPAAAGSKAEWESSHPWRPWDRDKDLNVPASKPKGAADLLKAAGSLSDRFGSSR